MAKIKVNTSGTYTVDDGDKVKIDIAGGGAVTLEAAPDSDDVEKLTIEFGNNDSQSDVVTVDLSTFAEDDLHLDIKKYDSTDQIILKGATITGVDPSNSSKLTFTYVGEDGGTYNGFVHLKDSGEKDFNSLSNPIVICFAKGTLIATHKRDVPVEDLVVGDLVMTRENGLQPIRWIGSRKLDSIDLAQWPHLYPIRIRKDALENGLPSRDLLVSPQHRICLGGRAAQLLFGFDEILVAAKHLTNESTIIWDKSVSDVCYFHILFDQHQVIYSNGSPSESLHVGDMALSALEREALDEIFTLFPELMTKPASQHKTTLPVIKSYEAKVMMEAR